MTGKIAALAGWVRWTRWPAFAVALCTLLLAACSVVDEPPPVAAGADVDAGLPGAGPLSDRDGDGLCDQTEADLGTNPDALDGDNDGIPDLIEVALDYDSQDPSVPGSQLLVRLPADIGATAELTVRVSVEGAGEAYQGLVEAEPSLYDLGFDASAFFAGVYTSSATPQDNVRELSASGAYIGSVLGHTQLGFRLQFAYQDELEEVSDCVLAFPFRFLLKSDEGEVVAVEPLMIAVGPPEVIGAAERYCLPSECI